MTRQTLITAVVAAALASPLAAADQTVEKATRYRATTTGAVSQIEPGTLELDSLAEFVAILFAIVTRYCGTA